MNLKFDELCSKYVGENIMNPTTPNKQTTTTSTTQTQPTPPQPTPPAKQTLPNIEDNQLLELLKQKMADDKFKQVFSQWLQTQNNAA
jgi:hypothetical protein